MKKLITFAAVAIAAVVLAACTSNSDNSKGSNFSEAKVEKTTSSSSKAEPTAEDKAALEKAKQTLESFHLSKEKLKSLLVEQEKFTEESAQYAIDNKEFQVNPLIKVFEKFINRM